MGERVRRGGSTAGAGFGFGLSEIFFFSFFFKRDAEAMGSWDTGGPTSELSGTRSSSSGFCCDRADRRVVGAGLDNDEGWVWVAGIMVAALSSSEASVSWRELTLSRVLALVERVAVFNAAFVDFVVFS